MAQCGYCKGEIVGGNGNTKYCSINCRKKESVRLRDERGIVWRSRKVCKCKWCGVEFRPKLNGDNKGFYCSRECSFKDSKARFADREKRERHSIDGYMFGKTCKVWFGKCIVCGEWFCGRRAGAILCRDYKCKAIKNGVLDKGKVPKKYGEERVCPDCGEVWVISYGQKGPRTERCLECNANKCNRINKHVRRARIGGSTQIESFDPLYIFKRDKWTCYICGLKMNPHLFGEPSVKGHHEDSGKPTVDHVVPISMGGTHTKDNVRACCSACNVEKGTMPLTDKGIFFGRYSGRPMECMRPPT